MPRNRGALILGLLGAMAAATPAITPAQPVRTSNAADEKAAIRTVIATMEAAWNRGDFRGYMDGFLNPGVTFVSRGRFQRDWQGTLDHYIRDYGASPEKRGTLHFYDIRVEMLSPDAAQLISRFHLAAATPQYGVNTRLMRKVRGRWVIALNHVSAVDTPDPEDPVPAHRRAE
jgi:ketosteroid isomerase-like protein